MIGAVRRPSRPNETQLNRSSAANVRRRLTASCAGHRLLCVARSSAEAPHANTLTLASKANYIFVIGADFKPTPSRVRGLPALP